MLSLFIAKKIHSEGAESRRVSKPAVTIATIGTAIGLAVMIISVSVVLGFKGSIRDKIVGYGSHITVSNANSNQRQESKAICVSDSLVQALKKAPGVAHIQPYAYKQGILKSENDFLLMLFKGVDETWDSSFFKDNIVNGTLPVFSSKQSSNNIAISKIVADKLQLKVGDKIFAYFVDSEDMSPRSPRKFTIAAIFDTNLTKFDESICLADIYTTRKLNSWEDDQATGCEILVKDFDKLNTTADYLVKNINRKTDKYGETYTSSTVQQSNPQIFSWLSLLDLNIWIILALMVCVAAVTMTSGLMIIILERVQMIGILKALGARNGMIRHTFLWFAVFIIARGVIIGDIVGIGICLLQKYTGIVKLDASTYYVSEVPVDINIPLFLLLNVATIIVCTLVLVAPSYLVSRIKPAKSIRFE